MWERWFATHGGAVVVKVLAHASSVDVLEGRIMEWERKGNAQADHYAKMGGRLHRLGERDRFEFLAIADLAQQAALASAEVSHHQASHSHCDFEEVQRAAAPRRHAPLLVVTGGPARCAGGPAGARARPGGRRPGDQLGATGPPPHRLLGHSLVAADLLDEGRPTGGALLWCKVCGRYLAVRVKEIGVHCSGRRPEANSAAAQVLRRIDLGRHPCRDPATRRLRLGGRRQAGELDVARLRAFVEAEEQGDRNLAAARLAQAQEAWAPAPEVARRLARREVLAAYGLTEVALDVLVARTKARLAAERASARRTREEENERGDWAWDGDEVLVDG